MSTYIIDFGAGRLVPIDQAPALPIGRVLTYEDRANARKHYVITGGIEPYGQPCVCEDGHPSKVSSHSVGRSGWSDTGKTLDGPALARFLADAKREGERLALEKSEADAAKAIQRAATRERLLRDYAFLARVEPGQYRSAKLGAANLRKELKRAFPGVKFSVRSDVYSGGSSIDVSWSLGPTSAEVRPFADKYNFGSFNGMEDIYEYDRDNRKRALGSLLRGSTPDGLHDHHSGL